jgi:hypothetical protein
MRTGEPPIPNGALAWPREASLRPGGVGEPRSGERGVSRVSGEGAEPPGGGLGRSPG